MSDQRSRIQQRQRALLDAIESMDTERNVGDEWRPCEEVAHAVFVQEIERQRAERLPRNRFSRGARLLALLRQPMPVLSPNFIMGISIPEYGQKEE